ncbi:hypothetical protein F5X96DRAFT_332019 [Biscogniauxia mediterranea]|nr:hypothetical protein F5X96DRAFT_332019 [Biscogniauxia mediterranea]
MAHLTSFPLTSTFVSVSVPLLSTNFLHRKSDAQPVVLGSFGNAHNSTVGIQLMGGYTVQPRLSKVINPLSIETPAHASTVPLDLHLHLHLLGHEVN